MPSGGSVGEGYGPMIVASRPMSSSEVKTVKVAVPGTMTTAYLSLKLFAPEVATEVVPFDEIIPRVLEGKYAAGLIIHEGQLTFTKSGLHKVLDMGKWWRDETGLPLPLGGNAIRRDLGSELISACCGALRDSIQYALDNREEALQYAMQFARDLEPQMADKFVGMYVNERTLDYGSDGRKAIAKLLQMGYDKGIIPHNPNVEFVGDAAIAHTE
jgi:1,4-dihydroxy-6-naphthoate synthase